MKKAIALMFVALIANPAFAAVKCERDNRGNMCCWDTVRDGPFKPISCY